MFEDDLGELLSYVAHEAADYLRTLPERPTRSPRAEAIAAGFGGPLPEEGDGALAAVKELFEAAREGAVHSQGGRFYGFVNGAVTPAAQAADWVTSTFDQNLGMWVSSPIGARLEQVSLGWLRELFGLPAGWGGVLTSGATAANFSALAAARRWWGLRHGFDVDEDGLAGKPPVPVLSSGYLHASATKALAMLGIGRSSVTRVAADGTGRVDLEALEAALAALDGAPAILVANAGEVNAGDFDPIDAFADLAQRYGAWLHVDGAFGLFAALSDRTRHLVAGIERADSVISDGHKWLNVPYDCGFAFVRDAELLEGAFRVSAAYLTRSDEDRPNYSSFGPEASRRARSFTVWATLRAYGRAGYRRLVDHHLSLAQRMGDAVSATPDFELLAPVQLNIVCFRYHPQGADERSLDDLNTRLGKAVLEDGRFFVGTTVYDGKVAFRPALVSWRITEADVDEMVRVLAGLAAALPRS